MNSENSSNPPLSDGPAKKQKATPLCGIFDKAGGGQPGYKGRTLRRVAELTDTQDHRTPSHCNRCHKTLPFEEAHVLERRRVFDREMTGLSVPRATLLAWVGESSQTLQGTAELIARQWHVCNAHLLRELVCAQEMTGRV